MTQETKEICKAKETQKVLGIISLDPQILEGMNNCWQCYL